MDFRFRLDFINLITSNIRLKFFISFIRFPWKDPEVLEKWLEILNLRDWHPNNLGLCSSHFKDECFDRTGFRVSSKKGSVPTEFGNQVACCIFRRWKRKSDTENCFYKSLSRNEKDHHFERNDRNIENFEMYYFLCRFPMNDSKLLEAWIEKLNKTDWQPTETSVLCSEHFEKSCFRISNGKHMPLKTNSVPTIFDTENVDRNRLQNKGKPTIWLQYWQYSEDFFDVIGVSIAKTFSSTAKNFFNN